MKQKALLIAILYLQANYAWANQCDAVFTEAASSHSTSGSITFEPDSRIEDSNGTLDIPNITDQTSGRSCQSASCVSSGNAASGFILADFMNSSSSTDVTAATTLLEGEYRDITIDTGTVTFSSNNGAYFINTLEVTDGATAEFAAGDYWIDTLTFGEETKLVINGTDTVRIYAQSVIIGEEADINIDGNRDGSPELLVITSYNDITLQQNSETAGLLYAENKITFNEEATLLGSASATAITMEADSRLFYQDVIDNTNFGSLCGDIQFGFYEFEDIAESTNDIVSDSSDASNNGSVLGDAITSIPNEQVSCKVLDIPDNIDRSVIDALDTNIDINSLGNDGTISFWYKSNEDWSSGGDRQLLDASTRAAGNKYFFLVLRSNGSLRFGIEYNGDDDLLSTTSAYSFSADEWVHIAVTWNSLTATLQLYVNGVRASTTDSIETPTGGTLDTLGTLHIGDNSSTYAVNGSSPNSANGNFDDVRVYNFIQSLQQINTDLETLSPCNIEPIIYYPFEDVSWSAGDSVDDESGMGNNASPLGDIELLLQSNQISCQLLDVPFNNNQSTTDAIDSGLDVNDIGNTGTISFWYRSNENWDDSSERQLFDASNDALADRKHFYLALAGGTLEFGIEDEDDRGLFVSLTELNYAAQEWVFVAVTWDMKNQQVNLYTQQPNSQLSASNTRTNLVDELGDMDTLYFGDNRGTYFVNNTLSTANSANGQFDNIRVFNLVKSQAQIIEDSEDVTVCETLNHYRIEHDTQGFTCEAEPITIKACANEDCDILYSQPVSVTLTPSGWEGGDTVAFTEEITTSLSITDKSTITFGNSATTPSAELRCFNGSNETCQFEFVDAGFEFIGATVNDKTLIDQIAETNFTNINLRAIKNDGNGACVTLLDDGLQDIGLSFDCDDPSVCKTTLSHNDINLSELVTQEIKLDFTDGIASLENLNYPDAGRLTLNAEAKIDGATITSGGALVDVYPDNLALSVAVSNLLYTGSADTDTYAAGEKFSLSITAYGAIGTNALPNYQPGELELALTRNAPSSIDASDGILTYATGGALSSALTSTFKATSSIEFVDGIYNYLANYSEVGRIAINVQDSNYLGNRIASQGELVLGSFIPAYFDIVQNSPSLLNTCNTFSYVGEYSKFNAPLTYTVTARSAISDGAGGHTTTQNYGNDWWQLSLSNSNMFYIDNVGNNGEISGDMSSGDTELDYDGQAIYTISQPLGTEFSEFSTPVARTPKSTTLLSPFSAAYTPILTTVDIEAAPNALPIIESSNGVCFQKNYPDGCTALAEKTITGANLRYGRLVLESTFGPETEPLQVPIKTEYYTNGQWLLNIDDNCTSIAMSEASNHMLLTAEGSPDLTDNIEDITSADELLEGIASNKTDFLLNAPTKSGILKLQLDPDNDPTSWSNYLNYDWNGDDTINSGDYPEAIITFGQFRGNDRIIHWREIYN